MQCSLSFVTIHGEGNQKLVFLTWSIYQRHPLKAWAGISIMKSLLFTMFRMLVNSINTYDSTNGRLMLVIQLMGEGQEHR
jgi:hypothetical protein